MPLPHARVLWLTIAAAMLSMAPPAHAEPARTVVLVHGAFADGSSWAKVIPILERQGLNVVVSYRSSRRMPRPRWNGSNGGSINSEPIQSAGSAKRFGSSIRRDERLGRGPRPLSARPESAAPPGPIGSRAAPAPPPPVPSSCVRPALRSAAVGRLSPPTGRRRRPPAP